MQNSVNKRVKQYEDFLAIYIAKGVESLEGIGHRFVGEFWLKTNKPSIQSADLDPYALKEAYLKACDHFGVERPDSGRFVEDSEAKLDAPFWETGVNPVTMTKIHETNDYIEDADVVDYNYTF